MGRRFVDSFRRVPGGLPITGNHGYHINDDNPEMAQAGGRFYDLRAANVRTANSALARDLKGRHLQMIAIGGSVGIVISLLLSEGKGLKPNIRARDRFIRCIRPGTVSKRSGFYAACLHHDWCYSILHYAEFR